MADALPHAEREAYGCRMPSPGFEILYEDPACLVVNKPAGLLTQAPLGIDSLEFRIKRYLQEHGQPGDIYLGLPHRLDRPVSGVIVFAKTLKSAQKLSMQFERRFVRKIYWALVEGDVQPDQGTWTDHLQKIEGVPQSIVVDAAHPESRIAILKYRVLHRLLARSRDIGGGVEASPCEVPATLLEIELETGRTHQIRVQCASRGHRLLGDTLYGSRWLFGPWTSDIRELLIALHARSLTFRHPQSKADLTYQVPLPQHWVSAGVSLPNDE